MEKETIHDSPKILGILALSLFMLASGTSLVSPILPLFIKDLGNYDPGMAAKWSGWIQGITFVMSAIFSPIWGVVGDKYGRKSMVLRAFYGMAGTMVLMMFATTPLQIFFIRMLHGCLAGAVSATIALVSTVTHDKKMASTMGILHTAMMSGTVGGPFLGGILADAMGFRMCFLVTSSILFLCGILITFFIPNSLSKPNLENRFSLLENFNFFFHHRMLLLIAFVFFLSQMGRMGVNPVLPLFISTIYNSKTMLMTVTGSAFSITGLSSAITATYWGKRADKKGYRSTLLIVLSATAIGLGMLPFTQKLWQVYGSRIVMGLFLSGIAPLLQSLIALNTPQKRRGSMYGTVMMGQLAGNAVGPITSGMIAKRFGFRVSFGYLSFLLFSAMTIVAAFFEDKKGNVKTEETEEEISE